MIPLIRPHLRSRARREALFLTLGILPPTGFVLDMLFADRFFTFANRGSVIGLYLPGFSFETGAFTSPIPVEEFVFYVAGFVFNLFAYVAASQVWLERYSPDDLEARVRSQRVEPSRVLTRGFAALTGLAVAGFLLKWSVAAEGAGVVPEYYLFILAFGVTPVLFLVEWARPIINWQAVSFVMLSVLVISIVWEVTLGVPYGWWGYKPEPMIGIFIKPWTALPLEAVFVWICVTFTTSVVFEALTAMLIRRGR